MFFGYLDILCKHGKYFLNELINHNNVLRIIKIKISLGMSIIII